MLRSRLYSITIATERCKSIWNVATVLEWWAARVNKSHITQVTGKRRVCKISNDYIYFRPCFITSYRCLVVTFIFHFKTLNYHLFIVVCVTYTAIQGTTDKCLSSNKMYLILLCNYYQAATAHQQFHTEWKLHSKIMPIIVYFFFSISLSFAANQNKPVTIQLSTWSSVITVFVFAVGVVYMVINCLQFSFKWKFCNISWSLH